jgi:FkbM family methyltransferase
VHSPPDGQPLQRAYGFLRSLIIYLNPVTLRAWRRFYATLLNPGDLVIDVGAHMGTRALAMRAVGATVIALEPQKPFSTFLQRTMPRDIVVIEAAAGRSESTAEMAVSSRHPTVSSLRPDFVSGAASAEGFEQVRWNDTQEVAVVTLDSVISRYGTPRYIKIDVEGFEEEVLGGLSTAVEILSVEYLPGFPQLSLAVLERVVELGDYRFNPVAGESGQFLWDEWLDAPATAAWLASLPASGSSGDLFARLQSL